jgi:hypothetical protein
MLNMVSHAYVGNLEDDLGGILKKAKDVVSTEMPMNQLNAQILTSFLSTPGWHLQILLPSQTTTSSPTGKYRL